MKNTGGTFKQYFQLPVSKSLRIKSLKTLNTMK